MAIRNVSRIAPVLSIILVVVALASNLIGHILQKPHDPYENLLKTPYDVVAGYSRCYPPAPEYSGYCIHDLGVGSIAFSMSGDTVSISGTSLGMRMGDLVSLYGQPTATYRHRYFVTWVWRQGDFQIMARCNGDASVWELVRWFSVSRIG